MLDRRQLAKAAALTAACYEPWNVCAQQLAAAGYDGGFETFEEGVAGTQAYVAWNDDDILFCFRGSDDLVDWIRNLKFVGRRPFLDNRLNGNVHRGFYESFAVNGLAVSQRIRRLHWQSPRRVIGLGHSLGAAIAAMTARAYLEDYAPTMWLFGCPRIGDEQFADEYNDRFGNWTYNIRNRSDLVTLSPFWNHPIGQEFYLTGRGRILYWPSDLRLFWERIKATAGWAFDWVTKRTLYPRSFADHSMNAYRAITQRIAGEPAP